MRLQQIKLTGFKSFVDTTVIPFPGQLVGVLGPNGCGKSNVIDAVRWVLGESSAKNLRGESMADVIFNGSTNRRASGQASVELVFDNSGATLPGPFGAYREISVRRVVTRDGESGYFLNGTRCRRRDITDLFLGTGAGARGYSIIGQGTVSKIVEARPEELRAYLEEAAGVSRYRDRRRETVQRMEQARENLERVALLREELDKQLARLERQAKTAERFRTLKARERVCKTGLLLVRRDTLSAQRDGLHRTLRSLEDTRSTQEALHARLTAEALACRDRMESRARTVTELQEQCYRLGTEIARLEEQRAQALRAREQLLEEQLRLKEVWQQAHDRYMLAGETLTTREAQSQVLAAELETLRARLDDARTTLDARRQALEDTEARLESARSNLSNARQQHQLSLVRAENLKARLEDGERRLAKNQAALDGLAESDSDAAFLALLGERDAKIQDEEAAAAQHARALARVQEAREALMRLGHEKAQAQKAFAEDNAQLVSLRAVQQSAGSAASISPPESVAHLPQLMASLKVEDEWQTACEQVFADALHAYVVQDVGGVTVESDTPLALLEVRVPADSAPRFPSLLQKMRGAVPCWLHAPEYIYTVDSLEEARRMQSELLPHESVITLDGAWLGPGWIQVPGRARTMEEGVLARQARIDLLAVVVGEKENTLMRLQAEDAMWRERLQTAEQEEREAARRQSEAVKAVFDAQSALSRLEQQREALKTERARLVAERNEWNEAREELTLQMKDAAAISLEARELEAEYLLTVESIEEERRAAEGAHRAVLIALEELREEVHESGRRFDRLQAEASEARRTMEREAQTRASLENSLEDIAEALASAESPGVDMHEVLQEKISRHAEYETLRESANSELDTLREQFTTLEAEARLEDEKIKKSAAQQVELQLQEQTLAVRLQTLAESLAEFGPEAPEFSQETEAPATEAACEEELLVLADAIRRLGAINLAAIEEYETERVRRDALNAQHEDLSSALATLEEAIAKLDAETKVRFQETFDAVNTAFQALFPRLFGGGRATLSLTCDNLLEAGVMVLAQPPGKRNSTIHLLSGGEKAMTAVALIFAIFQLNPSPFCMLDEVDAPLDDVNVGRFCDLVREMSQFVQFLFITHNRVTMELAENLIGVTMREPGVSRVVAVDVEQALTFCEA